MITLWITIVIVFVAYIFLAIRLVSVIETIDKNYDSLNQKIQTLGKELGFDEVGKNCIWDYYRCNSIVGRFSRLEPKIDNMFLKIKYLEEYLNIELKTIEAKSVTKYVKRGK